MRDGRLSAVSRALVLKSCGATISTTVDAVSGISGTTRVMLADTVIPSNRAFKTYLPTNSDSTLFRSPLPRAYTSTGSPLSSTENIQPTNTPVEASTSDLGTLSSSETANDSTKEGTIEPSTDYNRETLVNNNSTRDSSSSSSVSHQRSVSSLSDEPTPKENTTPKPIVTKPNDLNPPPTWQEPYKHMDCEWSMRTMDALFNASFVEFIKNEKNCEFNGRHVAHLVKDYKLDQVVQGIKWLVEGWSIEGTARLLKNIFDDWLPELAAFAIARIGCEWPLRPKMGLIVAFMMMGESPNVAALFIRSLTIGWDSNQITELISCLDTVLEWEDDYFTKFTELLLLELNEATRVGEIHNVEPDLIIKALAAMYKTTAAMTNHRIVMADLRLAVAKSHYLTQFAHSITCQDCLHRRACGFSSRALPPSPASIIAAIKNRIRPGTVRSGNNGFVIGPTGIVRPATEAEAKADAASKPDQSNPSQSSVTTSESTASSGSQNDFSYLLDRIPPSLREFFGGIGATSETDFIIPGSTEDFLYNFDDQDDGDYTNGDDEEETDSILNNPLLATRTNSILSLNGVQTVNRGVGSEFSRGPSEASFLLARQTSGVGSVSAGGASLMDSTGMVLPNAVFETHQQSMDDFRSASSMMSLALSSLDLTGVSGPLNGGGERELFDADSIADARRVVFSRGVTSGASGILGSSVGRANGTRLTRGESIASFKSID
ncbi:UNVERIFIED_CONTAM: hypothetical protein HDU68_007617 [Siphonaria sp. JEL0065]|nr:hypothetical protein HDU68_007617 [Siphonaria sp. JEL0065]